MVGLARNKRLSTVHRAAYSGNFGGFVKRAAGSRDAPAHKYVDLQRLQKFLVGQNLLTGNEFALDGGTNGFSFWTFSFDRKRHAGVVRGYEQSFKQHGCALYSAINPGSLSSGGDTSLVTRAYVVSSTGVAPIPGEIDGDVEPVEPERFGRRSFLSVEKMVVVEPYFFQKLTKGKLADENESRHVAETIRDLRGRITGRSVVNNHLIFMHSLFGYYQHGMFMGSPEGVLIKIANPKAYQRAQEIIKPAFVNILLDPAVEEAIVTREEIANSVQSEGVLTLGRANIRRQFNDSVRAIGSAAYQKAIDAAAKNLKDDPFVREVFDLI